MRAIANARTSSARTPGPPCPPAPDGAFTTIRPSSVQRMTGATHVRRAFERYQAPDGSISGFHVLDQNKDPPLA